MKENVLSEQEVSNEESVSSEKEISKENTDVQNDELILGKFKDVEDLSKAYQNLQKQQGQQSEELGKLRKLSQKIEEFSNKKNEIETQYNEKRKYIEDVLPKYDNDEYFKNEDFKTLYKEAFNILGTNLDTDKFVSLLENYVKSRFLMNEKSKNIEAENNNATDNLQFQKGISKKSDDKIRMQDIPDGELEKYIAKYV